MNTRWSYTRHHASRTEPADVSIHRCDGPQILTPQCLWVSGRNSSPY